MGERNSRSKLGVSRCYDQIENVITVMGRQADVLSEVEG